MSGDNDDFVEELRVVRRAKDSHRSKSKATPGYDRDLLRDGESLRGPSESREATLEDVEEHLMPYRWEDAREPEPTGPTFGQQLGTWIAEVLIETAKDPEVQANIKARWTVFWEYRREQRALKHSARASPAAEITLGEAGEGPGDSLEPVELEREAISAEAYNELLRMRLFAKEMLERSEARLGEVQVEDDGHLASELQAAHRAAMEGNLRDLDQRTLELLGFTWDPAVDDIVPELVERDDDPPQLSR